MFVFCCFSSPSGVFRRSASPVLSLSTLGNRGFLASTGELKQLWVVERRSTKSRHVVFRLANAMYFDSMHHVITKSKVKSGRGLEIMTWLLHWAQIPRRSAFKFIVTLGGVLCFLGQDSAPLYKRSPHGINFIRYLISGNYE